MNLMSRVAGVATAVLSMAVPAVAQHLLPTGKEALGKVHFETSCKADVRDGFDRAVDDPVERGGAVHGLVLVPWPAARR